MSKTGDSQPHAGLPVCRALLAALVLLCAAGACAGDDTSGGGAGSDAGGDGQACLDQLDLDCTLAFAPTYEAFYDNQLKSCGAASTGTACHGSQGGQAGLFLDDPDSAYDHLLGNADGKARVIAGDPECSPLIKRLEADDPKIVMPPGAKLTDAELCSIRNWVADGAEK